MRPKPHCAHRSGLGCSLLLRQNSSKLSVHRALGTRGRPPVPQQRALRKSRMNQCVCCGKSQGWFNSNEKGLAARRIISLQCGSQVGFAAERDSCPLTGERETAVPVRIDATSRRVCENSGYRVSGHGLLRSAANKQVTAYAARRCERAPFYREVTATRLAGLFTHSLPVGGLPEVPSVS